MPNPLSDRTQSPIGRDAATAHLAPAGAPTRFSGLRATLGRRLSQLYAEAGKFGAIGLMALAIEITLYDACLLVGVNAMIANAISTVVAASVAFAGNRYWTWRDRAHTGLRREYLVYFLLNTIGLMITMSCLWLSHDLLGQWWPKVFQNIVADNVAAKGVGMALATVFRFWAYRRWVFPEAAASVPGADLTPPELGRHELALLEVDNPVGVTNSTVGVSG
jgi:putative flippase GtrA